MNDAERERDPRLHGRHIWSSAVARERMGDHQDHDRTEAVDVVEPLGRPAGPSAAARCRSAPGDRRRPAPRRATARTSSPGPRRAIRAAQDDAEEPSDRERARRRRTRPSVWTSDTAAESYGVEAAQAPSEPRVPRPDAPVGRPVLVQPARQVEALERELDGGRRDTRALLLHAESLQELGQPGSSPNCPSRSLAGVSSAVSAANPSRTATASAGSRSRTTGAGTPRARRSSHRPQRGSPPRGPPRSCRTRPARGPIEHGGEIDHPRDGLGLAGPSGPADRRGDSVSRLPIEYRTLTPLRWLTCGERRSSAGERGHDLLQERGNAERDHAGLDGAPPDP